MTSADDVAVTSADDVSVMSADDVSVMMSPRADVSKRRLSALRRVAPRELLRRIFWRRVRAHGSSDGGQVSTRG